MEKIGIIGHFGNDKEFLDGQTIKTRILYDELKKNGKFELVIADTYFIRTAPFKLLWQTFRCLWNCKKVIILLSGRGMRVYFPLLYYWNKFFGIDVFHDIIGGSLDRYIKQRPRWKKYVNSFKVNWAETRELVNNLSNCGISNAELLYNFKPLSTIPVENLKKEYSEPFRLCTFSRVMKEKGIEDAIKAVTEVNKAARRTIYSLDIYGQVDSGQKEWFENVKKNLPEYIHYQGSVSYDKSVEVLKEYFALVFPTRYYTEGVPGTIIDAYAAGLPVIASKWENFDNIIDEKTGISYKFEDVDDFVDVLSKIAQQPDAMIKRKIACVKKAKDFMPETVMCQIIEKISKK